MPLGRLGMGLAGDGDDDALEVALEDGVGQLGPLGGVDEVGDADVVLVEEVDAGVGLSVGPGLEEGLVAGVDLGEYAVPGRVVVDGEAYARGPGVRFPVRCDEEVGLVSVVAGDDCHEALEVGLGVRGQPEHGGPQGVGVLADVVVLGPGDAPALEVAGGGVVGQGPAVCLLGHGRPPVMLGVWCFVYCTASLERRVLALGVGGSGDYGFGLTPLRLGGCQ